MKFKCFFCLLLVSELGFISGFAQTSTSIPHLEKRDGMTKLIVDGKPFICVAGELANSSSTDIETMKLAWAPVGGISPKPTFWRVTFYTYK